MSIQDPAGGPPAIVGWVNKGLHSPLERLQCLELWRPFFTHPTMRYRRQRTSAALEVESRIFWAHLPGPVVRCFGSGVHLRPC